MDNAFVSKYVARGIVVDDEPVYQPAITATDGNASINVWANRDLTNWEDARGRFTEVDYTANYRWTLHGKTMNSGYVYYSFPNTELLCTAEVYSSISLSGPLSPSLIVYYDCHRVKSYYTNLTLAYSIKMPKGKIQVHSLDLTAKIGYGAKGFNRYNYWGTSAAGFTDLLLSVGVSWPVNKKLTVTPSLIYTRILDGRLRSAVTAQDISNDNLVGSLIATVAF